MADIGPSGSSDNAAVGGGGGSDFLEIDAIPPLPLFALLTADDGKAAAAAAAASGVDASGKRKAGMGGKCVRVCVGVFACEWECERA